MCGRYYIEIDEGDLDEIVREAEEKVKEYAGQITMKTRGDIYPTDIVPVLTEAHQGEPMQWGFSLAKGRPVINARCESVFEKAMFRQSVREHRCLIPASAYYEWASVAGTKKKDQYVFQAHGSILYFAGCYRYYHGEKARSIPQFVILTRQAADGAVAIHDRMPVIIPEHRIEDWLCSEKPAISFDESITALQIKRYASQGTATDSMESTDAKGQIGLW